MTNIPAIYQGKLNTLDQIKISPLSRAYTFSDSIYEVIPYFLGKPLCFQQHIDRMVESAKLSGLDLDFQLVSVEMKELAKTLVGQDGYVYFQISRGVDLIRSHLYKDDLEVERFGYAMPGSFPASPISAMLCEDNRWANCHIKSTSLLGNVLLMNQAKAQGCQEIVMHRNGYMTEAGASNVFYFDQSGTIRTSALTENILPGITRDILIKALNDTSHQVTEGSCSIEDFDHSPCIWLSSSTKGILPLTNLIGTEYRFQEDHAGYKEVLRVFNAAMQSHLSVLE